MTGAESILGIFVRSRGSSLSGEGHRCQYCGGGGGGSHRGVIGVLESVVKGTVTSSHSEFLEVEVGG